MERKMRLFLGCLSLAVIAISTASCKKNEEPKDISEKEQLLERIATPYVTNTVRPTYSAMADASMLLADKCAAIQSKFAAGILTASDVKSAGDAWIATRKYWEQSEAFLFGPAANHNIDPHIDSWPLDKTALDNTLARIRNGESWSIETMGFGLLGFHAVEYMLFELSADGNTSQPRTAFTAEELEYLVAVAEDLRNHCVLLEACWTDNAKLTDEKQAIIEDHELDYGEDYGDMMIHAGVAGSIYKTYQAVAEEMIQGCIDIADEVANTKIGRPVMGSSAEDRNYIESPYSLNSITDFVDNIVSIEHVYCGSKEYDACLSDYVAKSNADLDKRIKALIAKSKETIAAIPEPFAKNTSNPKASEAIEVVGSELVGALEEVMTELSK